VAARILRSLRTVSIPQLRADFMRDIEQDTTNRTGSTKDAI